MNRLNPLFYGLFVLAYYAIVHYSRKKESPIILKLASRLLTLGLFSVGILSLGAYSLFIPEVGVFKRVIAGALTITMVAYFIHLIKDYIKE